MVETVLDDDVLSESALEFLTELHRRHASERRSLLHRRVTRREASGGTFAFLPETAAVRDGEWSVAPYPADLADRRCEITGPTDRKMMINALNSGASVFMADFEDSTAPTWENVLDGQRNCRDAVSRSLEHTSPDGKHYALNDEIATLVIRPRGWHLEEAHLTFAGEPASASLVDFGLYMFHNARALIESGSGPYFYLPKLEHHLEARLWNDVFFSAQDLLGIPQATIRATVLIETLPAAFQMDEILYELREHSSGLNAGRWDYIFSLIKNLRDDPKAVLPDRSQVTMTVPFMRAYTELMVKTCHRRGAHAIGGMSAFIPSRRDEAANAIAMAKVREDKQREANDGCDGTWVAHPDLVPLATTVFDEVLGDRPNQISRQRPDVAVDAQAIQTVFVPGGTITEGGIRTNVDVAIRYLASWLSGNGAAAIHGLMEDAATAEISRSQIWQWIRHGATTDDGAAITAERIRMVADDVMSTIESDLGGTVEPAVLKQARNLFQQVSLSADFPDFLTIPAYELIR